MKKTMTALTVSALLVALPHTSAMAAETGHKHSKAFIQELQHASFMPTLMKHLKTNKATLKITDAQMTEIQKYHDNHSKAVHEMVAKIIETEKKAKQLALDNYPPQDVIKAGNQSLKIRSDLMMAKVQCRSFIKTILKPEQYKAALTSYK